MNLMLEILPVVSHHLQSCHLQPSNIDRITLPPATSSLSGRDEHCALNCSSNQELGASTLEAYQYFGPSFTECYYGFSFHCFSPLSGGLLT